MNDFIGSYVEAADARIRCRLIEVDGCLRVEAGIGAGHRFDIEEVLHLVGLALEGGREVRISTDGYAR